MTDDVFEINGAVDLPEGTLVEVLLHGSTGTVETGIGMILDHENDRLRARMASGRVQYLWWGTLIEVLE